MVSAQLIATLDKLPPDLQTEILHYAEYLATKYTQTPPPETLPKTYRQAGTMKGMFTMSDDFDAPLEDLNDYQGLEYVKSFVATCHKEALPFPAPLNSGYNHAHNHVLTAPMSISQPLSPPPGFEQLTKTQQIDYVQRLWDLIVTTPDELPVPEWHLEIIKERSASQSTASFTAWGEVKQRLLNKYRER